MTTKACTAVVIQAALVLLAVGVGAGALPPKPDLSVYRIEWPNGLCPVVESVIAFQPNTNVVRVMIQNQSSVPVERPFTVKVVTRFKPQVGSSGESREYTKTVQRIGANALTHVDIESVRIPGLGQFAADVTVDSGVAIDEANELNNTASAGARIEAYCVQRERPPVSAPGVRPLPPGPPGTLPGPGPGPLPPAPATRP